MSNPFDGLDPKNPHDVVTAAQKVGIEPEQLREMMPSIDPYLGSESESGMGLFDFQNLALTGAMQANKMVVDTASYLGNKIHPKASETLGLDSASDFFQRGIDAAESLRSDRLNAEMSRPIYHEGTGEWQMPSAIQTAGLVTETLPMMPMFGGAGGATAKGLQAAGLGTKASTVAGYGGTNAAFIAGDTYSESKEAIEKDLLQNAPDATQQEIDLMAEDYAQDAGDNMLLPGFVTGAIGLGIPALQTVTKPMVGARARLGNATLGAFTEGASEFVEEAGQGVAVNNARIDAGNADLDLFDGVIDRGAKGLVGGVATGGAFGAMNNQAEWQQQAEPTQDDDIFVENESDTIAPDLNNNQQAAEPQAQTRDFEKEFSENVSDEEMEFVFQQAEVTNPQAANDIAKDESLSDAEAFFKIKDLVKESGIPYLYDMSTDEMLEVAMQLDKPLVEELAIPARNNMSDREFRSNLANIIQQSDNYKKARNVFNQRIAQNNQTRDKSRQRMNELKADSLRKRFKDTKLKGQFALARMQERSQQRQEEKQAGFDQRKAEIENRVDRPTSNFAGMAEREQGVMADSRKRQWTGKAADIKSKRKRFKKKLREQQASKRVQLEMDRFYKKLEQDKQAQQEEENRIDWEQTRLARSFRQAEQMGIGQEFNRIAQAVNQGIEQLPEQQREKEYAIAETALQEWVDEEYAGFDGDTGVEGDSTNSGAVSDINEQGSTGIAPLDQQPGQPNGEPNSDGAAESTSDIRQTGLMDDGRNGNDDAVGAESQAQPKWKEREARIDSIAKNYVGKLQGETGQEKVAQIMADGHSEMDAQSIATSVNMMEMAEISERTRTASQGANSTESQEASNQQLNQPKEITKNTDNRTLDEMENDLAQEREDVVAGTPARIRTKEQNLINDVSVASVIDATNKETEQMLDDALELGRNDIAEVVVGRAERSADNKSTTPGVSKDNPNYAQIKLDLKKRKKKAQDAAKKLRQKLNSSENNSQPSTIETAANEAETSPGKQKGQNETQSSPNQKRQLNDDGTAKDGQPIKAGDVFVTATGRSTTPYPKQKSPKYASQWLMENAKLEAEARGNELAASNFSNPTLLKNGELTTADREAALAYLNDDFDVGNNSKPTLKPLVDSQETQNSPVNNESNVVVEPYKNAVIVKGDTKPIKDQLKEAGGSWNGKLGGWIFPKSKREAAQNIVDNAQNINNTKVSTGLEGQSNESTGTSDATSNTGSSEVLTDEQSGTERGSDSNGSNGASGSESSQSNIRDGSSSSTKRSESNNNRSGNFRLDSVGDIANGTPKERVAANLAAIRLSKQLQNENRAATEDEKNTLAQYVGWGGLKSVFDNVGNRAKFEKEADAELKTLLTEEEYNAVRNSIRTAFYTSKDVVKGMWDGISSLGLQDTNSPINIIEPSVGTGNFIGWQPTWSNTSSWYATELDPVTGNIAKAIYDDADIRVAGFQDAPFKEGVADLVIGNPPFGSQPLKDKRFPDISGLSLHNFMVAKSAKLLRPNGLMAMVITNRFLDTKNQNHAQLSNLVEFVGAVRLPNNAFKSNAGTDVTTDIVLFRKLQEGEKSTNTVWTDTNGNIDGVKINKYFEQNPQNILGRLANDGTMYGSRDKGELTVHPTQAHSDLRKSIGSALRSMLKNVDVKRDETAPVDTEVMLNESELEIGGMMINADGKLLYRDEDNAFGANIVEVKPSSILDPKGQILATIQEMFNNNDEQKLLKFVRDNMLNTKGQPSSEYGTKAFKAVFDYLGFNGKAQKLKAPLSEVRQLINEAVSRKQLGETNFGKLKGMLNIRNTALALIKAEKNNASNIEQLRSRLNEQYNEFASRFGTANKPATISQNQRLLMDSISIETALDDVNENGKITKHAIFERRVIEPYETPTSAGSIDDAVTYSIQNTGKVSVDTVASLLDITSNEAREQLTSGEKPYLLMNPETGNLDFIDDYLSGNVKKKYKQAKEAGLSKNVELLKAVLPKDKPENKVKPSIRATWIDESIFEDFLEVMGYKGKVSVSSTLGKISLESFGGDGNTELGSQFKHDRITFSKLFEHAANGKSITIFDSLGSNVTVKNEAATKSANVLANKLAETFESWAKNTPDAKTKIAKNFNDRVNTHIERKYNGRLYLRPSGVNPKIDLRKTQLDGALRIIQSQNTLLDHVVGAGKTFTQIVGIMERKRLGLSKRPLLAVPNHIIGAFASDFYTLYPGANILVVSEKQMSKKNRKRFFSKIATGDYDAIIIGHSHLANLSNSPTAEQGVIFEKLQELREAKETAKREAKEQGRRGASVSQIEEAISRLKQKLEDMKEKAAKRDDNVGLNFEEMGIDYLAIDEAHEFKNLMYSTSSDRVVGMNDPKGSNKAFDLLVKVRTVQALGKRGGVSFMTGTPISNSLVEIYTMMYYLGYQDLKDNNISQFDAFNGAFLSTETTLEYTPTGTLKERKVLRGINNTKELAVKYRQFADVITREDLVRIYADDVVEQNKQKNENKPTRFPTPKIKGGQRQIDLAPATDQQKLYNDSLIARMETINSIKGREKRREYASIDNPLWVLSDAKKASLDIRLVDPTAKRDPTGKIARAAKNVKRIYDKWDADKGAQLVFSDMGVPAKFAIANAKKKLRELADGVMEGGKAYVDKRLRILADDKTAYTTIAREISERGASLLESGNIDSEAHEKFSAEMQKSEGLFLTADTGFSVYDDLRATLVEQGIPENEIAFIHDYDTLAKKKQLFDRVNSGKVRVLIGSSFKMGAGTNVQERLVALHHMDAPWRPSEMEQREGRIIRQGNKLYERDPDNFEVEIIAYATSGSSDPVMWQILERKAAGIEQFRQGEIDEYVEEGDSDSDSYAELKAQTTGNPIYKEKLVSDSKLLNLETEFKAGWIAYSSATRFLDRYEQEKRSLESGLEATQAVDLSELDTEKLNEQLQNNLRSYEAASERFEKELDVYETLSPEQKKKTNKPKAPKRVNPLDIDNKFIAKLKKQIVDPVDEFIKNGTGDKVFSMGLGSGVTLSAKIDSAKDGDAHVDIIIKMGDYQSFYVNSTARVKTLSKSATKINALMPNALESELKEYQDYFSERLKGLEKEKVSADAQIKKKPNREKMEQAEKENLWLNVEVNLADTLEDIRRSKVKNRYIDNSNRPISRSGFDPKTITPELYEFKGNEYQTLGVSYPYTGAVSITGANSVMPAIDNATGESVHLYGKSNKGIFDVLEVETAPAGVNAQDYNDIAEAFNDARTEAVQGVAADIRFNKANSATKTSGVNAKAATLAFKRFVDHYKGLEDNGFEQIITDKKPSEIFGPSVAADDNYIKGAFDKGTNRMFIFAQNHKSIEDVRQTIREELLVHKGLGVFSQEEIGSLITRINDTRNSKSRKVREIWEDIAQNYGGIPPLHQAEEFLGKVAQKRPSFLDKHLTKVLAQITKMLRKAGLVKQSITMSEMRNEIYRIGELLEQGKKPTNQSFDVQGAVDSGMRFSKSESKSKSMNETLKGSKIVNNDGTPKTVYHGTGINFDSFSKDSLGSFTGADSAKQGYFFTDSKMLAASFSSEGALKNVNINEYAKQLSEINQDSFLSIADALKLEDEYFIALDELSGDKKAARREVEAMIIERLEDDVSAISPDDRSNVKPLLDRYIKSPSKGFIKEVHLDIKKPHVVDAFKLDEYQDDLIVNAIKKAKAQGNDGVVIKGLMDAAVLDDKGNGGIRSTVYIVFNSSQAFSAGGINAETKTPSANNIRFNRSKTNQESKSKTKQKLQNTMDLFGRKGMFKLLPINQMVDLYDKTFTKGHIKKYYDLLESFGAYKSKALSAIDEGAETRWDTLQKENPKANIVMSRLMVNATMAQMSPDKSFSAQQIVMQTRDTINSLRRADDPTEAQQQYLADMEAKLIELEGMYKQLADDWRYLERNEPTAIDLYKEVRKAYVDKFNETKKALLARIMELSADDQTKGQLMTMVKLQFEKQLQKGDYFPLMRNGKFAVIARKGKEYIREHFEYPGEAREAEERYISQGFDVTRQEMADMDGSEPFQGYAMGVRVLDQIKEMRNESIGEDIQAELADTQSFVENLGELFKGINNKIEADELMDAIYQEMLKSLPNASAAKSFIHRNRTKGASNDSRRAFANSMFHSINRIAKIKYEHKFAKELNAIKEIADTTSGDDQHVVRDIHESLKERNNKTLNPDGKPFYALLSGLGFNWLLGGSVAAGAVNLSQVPLVTFPYLSSKYGNRKAAKEMTRAYNEMRSAKVNVKKGKGLTGTAWRTLSQSDSLMDLSKSDKLTEQERELLHKLADDGKIDLTQMHAMAQIADTEMRDNHGFKLPFTNKSINKKSFVDVQRAWGFFFHNAEVVNRQVTALATIRLAKENDSNLTAVQLYDLAANAIDETQFNYASYNRGMWAREDFGKIALMFMTYTVNIITLMAKNSRRMFAGDKEARKFMVNMMAAHFLAAGAIGLPLVEAIGDAIFALKDAIDGDDEPDDFKKWMDETIRQTVSLFGGDPNGDVAHMVSTISRKGIVNGLTGVNVADRVGLNNLIWRSDNNPDATGSEMVSNMLMGVSPVFSIAANFLNGTQRMGQGLEQNDEELFLRGLQGFVPKAAGDVVKGFRQYNYGESTLSGTELIGPDQINAWNALTQAIGFSSEKVRDLYERRSRQYKYDKVIAAKRNTLVRKTANAIMNGESMDNLLADIAKYNEQFPSQTITPDTIRRHILAKQRRDQQTINGIYTPKKRMGEVGNMQYYDNDN